MKIPPARADTFSLNPPANIRAILFYGPDSGLVRERAIKAARSVVDDINDPFSAVEFNASALKDDPSRLADEAAALSMAGRRVVRMRDATDSATVSIGDALALDWDALAIVEAGDLSPRSKLRTLFEKAEDAAAVACYLDDQAGLSNLARQTLREAGLSADDHVVQWIAANLGADRLVSRMELDKLVLYVSGKSSVSLEDAQAVIGDSALVTLDDVVNAAGSGNFDALSVALARARFEGVQPVAILRAALRHVTRLEEAVTAIDAGAAPDAAMKSLRPPVFFKQQDSFRAQLRRWRRDGLVRARAELLQAEIACKSTGNPNDAVCERALMRLAAIASARKR